MAPLGVLTVIVGAIRVGGPSWLKAIIGRARENLAIAEAELMSSTSKEVCELWNGQQVVRVMGQGPIREFIILFPEEDSKETLAGSEVEEHAKTQEVRPASEMKTHETGSEVEIKKLKDVENECFTTPGFAFWQEGRRKLRDDESQSRHRGPVIVIRNTSADAPNITLNAHDRVGRLDLYIVGIAGIIVQLGVLIYSGFYASLGLLKNGAPVAGYTFPCVAVGTVILITGMLTCAHVVESSTKEQKYQPKNGNAYVLWLQRAGTVNDQAFESFAVFTEAPRALITTSQRARDVNQIRKERYLVLELKAIVGAVAGIAGFIFQFVGLRAMHWFASVAQLGATVFMTILRAWVRRGLAKPPKFQRLLPGYELDWLAMTLGSAEGGARRYPPKTANSSYQLPWADDRSWDWSLATAENPSHYKKLSEMDEGESTADKVVKIRRGLSELADWPGSASMEAIALAKAMEATMDALFGNSPQTANTRFPQTYSLSLRINDGNAVHLHLKNQKGSWKAHAHEIEAVLSLWLFSVDKAQHDHPKIKGEPDCSSGDSWLRARGSPIQPSLQLLGPCTPGLRRDLQWWVPKELIHQDQARIMTVGDSEKGDDGTMNTILELEKHRVVGCGPRFSNTAPRPNDLVRYRSRELASGFESATTPGTFLATQTLIPLKLLYAQDLFTSFMWAVAKELATAVDGGAEVHHHDATGPDAWQSFTLHNNKISSLARTIQNTGLGSLDQIYLSIIPPLSVERKLPEPAKIVELALKHAEPDERVQRWEQAGEKYLWLFRVGMTFPQDSPLAAKATAVLLEHLRVLTGALEAKEALRYEWRVPSPILNDLISSTTKELESAGNIVIQLKELYQEQRRDCTFVPASPSEYDIQVAPNYSTLSDLVPDGGFLTWGLGSDRSRDQVVVNQRDAHNWTRLHYFAARGLRFNSELLLRHRADVNARDLFGWTPLHQACCHGEASVVQLLLLEGAAPDLRGSDGLAPLHCAAMNDNIDVLKKLLEAGASPDVLDAAGNTPLHWAAYRGCLETVKYLLVDRKTAPRNNWGRTPLHLAAAAGRVDVVRYLVSIVAIGAADRSGWTPLHCAATCGDVDVSRALIEAGADVKAKSKADLQTPLHFASEMGMMLLSNT